MIFKLIRTALWLLIHAVYTIIQNVNNIYCKIVINNNRTNIKNSYNNVIIDTKLINKIPNHILIILNSNENKNIEYNQLSKLIIWSLAAGISYITFYDYTGLLNANEDKLFKVVQGLKAYVPGYIKWKNQPDLNGYINGTTNKISVTILSQEDGKQKIVSVVKNMCQEVKKGLLNADEVDVNYVNRNICDACYSFPEPNVAMYFDNVCKTNGVLPWHIRLTEFLNLGNIDYINEKIFVDLLKKYGHCEQRFGT